MIETSTCVVCGRKFTYERTAAKRVTCDAPGTRGGCWHKRRLETQARWREANRDKIRRTQRLKRRKLNEAKALEKKPPEFPEEAFVNPHHRPPGRSVIVLGL